MIPLDVQTRCAQLQQTVGGLKLYALVDGLGFEDRFDTRLETTTASTSLFSGTSDAALSHAGPWLIDAGRMNSASIAELGELEREAPALIWLITSHELDDLARLLQLRLNIQIPDGRVALLRFWDPRVLANLAQTLDTNQREDFFGPVYEWHVLQNGQRAWIGRHNANAH